MTEVDLEYAQEQINEGADPDTWLAETWNEYLYEAFDWDMNDTELDALQYKFAELLELSIAMRSLKPEPEEV